MKKIILLFSLALCCLGSVRAEQSQSVGSGASPVSMEGMVLIEQVHLFEDADSLRLEMQFRVRGRSMSCRRSLQIIPELKADKQTAYHFPSILVNGKQMTRHLRRRKVYGQRTAFGEPLIISLDVSSETDTVCFYSVGIPYELWMDTASLYLNQIVACPAQRYRYFGYQCPGRVELQPHEPYKVNPMISFIQPDREEKQRKMQGQAFLDFQVGRSVILPDYRRNPEELAKIAHAVNKITQDADVDITGLFIEGYASPEGRYHLNERLSRERSEALKDYMMRAFGLPESLFRVSSVAEDWDGLRVLVDGSNIPQKDRVFAIIDSDEDYDRKESRLKALGGPWRTMLTEFFPQLRRVEYQVDFSVKDYSLEEARELVGRNPELLSQRELFLLAQSYPLGSTDRDAVFELLNRQYPNDVTATINSAAVMLERGEYQHAKRYLDRVEHDPRAWNNIGVCLLMTEDLDQAERYFNRALECAQTERPEPLTLEQLRHNLDELDRKRADNEFMKRYIR